MYKRPYSPSILNTLNVTESYTIIRMHAKLVDEPGSGYITQTIRRRSLTSVSGSPYHSSNCTQRHLYTHRSEPTSVVGQQDITSPSPLSLSPVPQSPRGLLDKQWLNGQQFLLTLFASVRCLASVLGNRKLESKS